MFYCSQEDFKCSYVPKIEIRTVETARISMFKTRELERTIDIQFSFTDRYRAGLIFEKDATRREIIDQLRELASEMEKNTKCV